MSELTITHAGTAVTQLRPGMASDNERLNQMKTKVFTVTPVTYAGGAAATGAVLFQADELANFMSEKGGTAIIQSVGILDDDFNQAAMDIVFMDTDGLLDATVGGGSAIDAADGVIADSVLGVATVTKYFNGIAWAFGYKSNIGLAIKAVDTTRSIWVAGVLRDVAKTYTAAGLRLKIGYIRD